MSLDNQSDQLNAANRIVDDAWQEFRCSPYIQQRLGIMPKRLPQISIEEAERRSGVGRSLLQRVESLDLSALSHDLVLSVRLVRFHASTWAREAKWYWTVTDPRGMGFYGMFLPTAYNGGSLLNLVHSQLASFTFLGSDDADRYLALVADYARLIDQFAARTAGQAERGIRMPKVQVPQARALLIAFRSSLSVNIGVAPHRLTNLQSGNFAREVNYRIATHIEPAFDRALEGLSEAYLRLAPDNVGIGQYPGGSELYAELVKLHTTLDLAPERVHAMGLARMGEIEESMHDLRSKSGFKGDHAEFLDHLNKDLAWRANTVEEVVAMFERCIERLKPHLCEHFATLPKASYGVAPLPKALEPSMTFGFFDPPKSDRARGVYLFNGENLTKQALFQVASLTYHELMPGHHLHLGTQQENTGLHSFRKYSFINAYNEGWAEYAAAFAGEIGMYQSSEEQYGRLMFDAFLTCRLVVDTGMNVFGWSLERSRGYLRKYSGLTDREIATESLRYSCDRPAQALAYKLGDTHLFALRERMRRSLGTSFALRDFHAAVLAPGALPWPDLEWHLARETERLRGGGGMNCEARVR